MDNTKIFGPCLLFALLLSSCTQFVSEYELPPLIPYYAEGKWGYADIRGNLVVTPRYDTASLLRKDVAFIGNVLFDGSASAADRSQSTTDKSERQIVYGLIDSSGREITAIDQPLPPDIAAEPYIVSRLINDTIYYGAIMRDGSIALPFKYARIQRLNRHLLLAYQPQYKAAAYWTKGKAHPASDKPWLNDRLRFYAGGAEIPGRDKIGVCNHYGDLIVDTVYSDVRRLFGEVYAVKLVRNDQTFAGCVNANRDTIIPLIYSAISRVAGKLIAAHSRSDPRRIILYNSEGVELDSGILHRIYFADKKYFVTERDRGWFSVNLDGKEFRLSRPEQPGWEGFIPRNIQLRPYDGRHSAHPRVYDGLIDFIWKRPLPPGLSSRDAYSGRMTFRGEIVDTFKLRYSPRKFTRVNNQLELLWTDTVPADTSLQQYTILRELSDRFREVKILDHDRYAVLRDSLWIIVDANCHALSPNSYEDITTFKAGICAVKNNKWAFINRRAELLCQYKFDKVSVLDSGYAAGYLNSELHLRDDTGAILQISYDTLIDRGISLDRFKVIHRGKVGFMTMPGEICVAPVWEEHPAHSLRFSSRIDRTVKDEIFHTSYFNKDGLRIVYRDGINAVIDTNGKVIVPPNAQRKFAFGKHDLLISQPPYQDSTSNKWMRIYDRASEAWSAAEFVWYGNFEHNRAAAQDAATQQFGYIDSNGRWLIDAQYEQAAAFHNGYAVVKSKGRYGIIDTNGTLTVEARYDSLEQLPFEDAALYRIVNSDDRSQVIDARGKHLDQFPPKAEFHGHKSHCIVKSADGKVGLWRSDGHLILAVRYNMIRCTGLYFCSNVFEVELENETNCYVDVTGRKYWQE